MLAFQPVLIVSKAEASPPPAVRARDTLPLSSVVLVAVTRVSNPSASEAAKVTPELPAVTEAIADASRNFGSPILTNGMILSS